MDLLEKIIDNNQSILIELKNALNMVNEIRPSIYAKPELVAGNASVGGHSRHIIDFYLAFFKGLEQQEIDYDQRARDPQVEQQTSVAVTKLEFLCQQLENIKRQPELELSVSVSTDPSITVMQGKSTLLRELQFIHSHTTHHMAIISIILRINDIVPEQNFGKAPSTVAFEQKQACVQ